MTEVDYFDEALVFVYAVIDQDWTVKKFAHSMPFADGASHTREASQ
ncbi:MAG TPA: hypothetical protein VJX72_10300 [Candidatus Acidoferrum sp.]|jgi:pyridoxal biosynthesis lyase PdxS|nr:hypothetical protein [Candidatus Acidoferrum sp.]